MPLPPLEIDSLHLIALRFAQAVLPEAGGGAAPTRETVVAAAHNAVEELAVLFPCEPAPPSGPKEPSARPAPKALPWVRIYADRSDESGAFEALDRGLEFDAGRPLLAAIDPGSTATQASLRMVAPLVTGTNGSGTGPEWRDVELVSDIDTALDDQDGGWWDTLALLRMALGVSADGDDPLSKVAFPVAWGATPGEDPLPTGPVASGAKVQPQNWVAAAARLACRVVAHGWDDCAGDLLDTLLTDGLGATLGTGLRVAGAPDEAIEVTVHRDFSAGMPDGVRDYRVTVTLPQGQLHETVATIQVRFTDAHLDAAATLARDLLRRSQWQSPLAEVEEPELEAAQVAVRRMRLEIPSPNGIPARIDASAVLARLVMEACQRLRSGSPGMDPPTGHRTLNHFAHDMLGALIAATRMTRGGGTRLKQPEDYVFLLSGRDDLGGRVRLGVQVADNGVEWRQIIESSAIWRNEPFLQALHDWAACFVHPDLVPDPPP